MKNIMKSYLIFTTPVYRLLTFFAVPVGLIGLLLFFGSGKTGVEVFLAALMFSFAEVSLDYWVFGGIAVKGGAQMEYLKSSGRGMRLLRTALAVNMARQLLGLILIILAMRVGFGNRGNVLWSVDAVLLGYLFIVAGTAIARFFDGIGVNMGISCIAFFPMTACVWLIVFHSVLMLAILLPLSAAVSAAGVNVVMKRIKEGYYDQTV